MVDLYWLPLGAGGWFVRRNGRAYERLAARLGGRERCDLYHAALEVQVGAARYTLEMAPALGGERGAVASGPVGARWAGRLTLFRYVVRCARDGVIPDLAEAVDSPRRLTDDLARSLHVVERAGAVPTPVWGRDELHAGEMWNSNSVVAWVLERSGIDAAAIAPPPGGRAPGWAAGVAVARRG